MTVCVWATYFLSDIIGKTSSVIDNIKAKFILMHWMQIKTARQLTFKIIDNLTFLHSQQYQYSSS